MPELWKDYWKLMGDPFSEEPLKYDGKDFGALVVETRSVQRAERIAEDLRTIEPTVHKTYVVGPRGMGKSTVMNFLTWKFLQMFPNSPVLPIYVSTLPPSRTVEELSSNFLKAIISQLFNRVIRDSIRIGISGTEAEKFFKDKRARFFENIDKIDTLVATSFLQECLRKLKDSGLTRYAVLFDELDRFSNQSLFLSFLKGSQGLFETLANDSVVFFMAGVPDWVELLRQEEYSGMRGEMIELTPWSSDDSYRLVSSRFERFSAGAKKNPFTPETVEMLTKQAEGRPRQVLSLTKSLLGMAATQRAKIIDDVFCSSFLWGADAMGQFKAELTKDDSAMRGATKLRRGFDPWRDDPRIFKVLSVVGPLAKLKTDVPVSTIRKDYGLDMDPRTFWNIIGILQNSKLLRRIQQPGQRDYYATDKDILALFSLLKRIAEPPEFLPYAASMIQAEMGTQHEPFSARIEVTRVLNRAPERFFSVEDLTNEILADPVTREAAIRSFRSDDDGEQHLYERVRRATVEALDALKRTGLVQPKEKNGISSYRWFPKHLDWKEFEGLEVDNHTLQGLEAAEMSFSKGMYDPSATLCRSVVEKAARKLYEEKTKQKCPRNWGLDALNDELLRLRIYDRKAHAKILGLLQQTNPIVHGEVIDVGERYARIVIDLTQESIKDIFAAFSKSMETIAPAQGDTPTLNPESRPSTDV